MGVRSRRLTLERVAFTVVGLALGECVIHLWLEPALLRSPQLRALAQVASPSASLLTLWMRTSVYLGGPLLAVGLWNFCEAHGWVKPSAAAYRTRLPPCPDPMKTPVLVIGEVHNQDGSPSAHPGWLVLPEKALHTGVLCIGGTGRGKTSGVLYPFLHQLLAFHAADPERRLGGLVIDAKGNMIADVRRMAREAGREQDLYELSLPSARYNILNRPDLRATALAGHLSDILLNIAGTSSTDPFWSTAARELATQVIRVVRLAYERPPTMADLYRLAGSDASLDAALQKAAARKESLDERDRDELQSLEFWFRSAYRRMDSRTRSNIAANLNIITSLFDEPELRRAFCPPPRPAGTPPTLQPPSVLPDWETFPGFDALLDAGKVVVLSVPRATLKTVSVVVATATKLNFQDALLGRLARTPRQKEPAGRTAFLLVDEFDQYTTVGDGEYLSKSREAGAVNVFAIQSRHSLTAKLRTRELCELVQTNLATRIWLGLGDADTARDAAEICGKVERPKLSRTISEGSSRASFSVFDGKALREGQATASASANWTLREEYLFPPRVFLRLPAFQAVVSAFDGERPLPPWVVYLRRYGDPPDRSALSQVTRFRTFSGFLRRLVQMSFATFHIHP